MAYYDDQVYFLILPSSGKLQFLSKLLASWV